MVDLAEALVADLVEDLMEEGRMEVELEALKEEDLKVGHVHLVRGLEQVVQAWESELEWGVFDMDSHSDCYLQVRWVDHGCHVRSHGPECLD